MREARLGDFEAVAELMTHALEPYYGGDHRRHAERIFQTHISGGDDRLGFFSVEQKMFIAEVDAKFAGLVHIVGKRQGTYKISPLIVVGSFRKNGVGSRLLEHAEGYAAQRGARQMYCTVAVANGAALNFFLRHGYTTAGQSASHYKDNISEAMLYKALGEDAPPPHDKEHISVTAFEPAHRGGVRSLLLRYLPQHFEGIDDAWVDSLFEGYMRRDTLDVNAKYKLIFVATDANGTVRGVVGATPKKGSPIKLMPVVSEDGFVFEALLRDVPYMLKEYGRKLYIHVQPNAEETVTLQKLGWTLDAVMPDAYGAATVTQQWSLDLGQANMRNMRMKRRFFDLIMQGKKDLEVRVGYDQIRRIEIGEHLRLSTANRTAVIVVKDKRTYETFTDMLAHERASRIAPDDPDGVEALLHEIYPSHKERLGVIVLEIVPSGSET